MKELSMKEVFEKHPEMFGFDPEITGASFFESEDTIVKVCESIQRGVPYIEPPVDENTDIRTEGG